MLSLKNNMINELDFPLLAGTIGAILHVVSGPDHLVAVALSRLRKRKVENWVDGG